MDKNEGFDMKEFEKLGPALIEQIESDVCAEKEMSPHSHGVAAKYSKLTIQYKRKDTPKNNTSSKPKI